MIKSIPHVLTSTAKLATVFIYLFITLMMMVLNSLEWERDLKAKCIPRACIAWRYLAILSNTLGVYYCGNHLCQVKPYLSVTKRWRYQRIFEKGSSCKKLVRCTELAFCQWSEIDKNGQKLINELHCCQILNELQIRSKKLGLKRDATGITLKQLQI